MNCKTCGYRLWNLASRTCPECGSAFAPGEFEFAPNEVQFCCPHCQQVYYGTSPIGHLVPDEFDCVSCGEHLTMDRMILRPADWGREQHTAAEVNPWLERRRRGRWRALFAMIGWGMARPGELMRVTPATAPMMQAWWYLIVSMTIYLLLGVGPIAGMIVAISLPTLGSAASTTEVIETLLWVLFSIAISGLCWVAYVLIWGAVAHLALVGAKPAGNLRRTYGAMCYTCGPMCVTALPCVGMYMFAPLGLVWWLVSAVLAVKQAQQVHGLRAAIAVTAWPTLVILSVIGLLVWAVVASGSAAGAATTAINARMEATELGNAVVAYAAADPAHRGPPHALAITGSQSLVSPWAFVDSSTNTTLHDAPVAGVDLEQFANAAPAQQQLYAQQAGQSQPANVVAHRLGDFVFTYHGIDFNQPNPGLWLLVFYPNPGVNPPPPATDECVVYGADGVIVAFPFADLPTELANQNAQRRALGLPPLPDPATVTHQQPAVGP